MSVRIEVDTDRLKSDRTSVSEELSAVRSELVLLKEEIAQMNRSWEGPASAAYQARMAEDLESAQSVCTYLQEYIACMDAAQTAYAECELSLEEIAASVRI